ncbi:MAG: N-acetyltransferase [Candidatus Latescibacterota bacterium]|nr:MAG: N-acetyltransferase [Candidatus Latescibacterota bacterium]
MANTTIGDGCSFGQNCTVEKNVVIGNNVKVQNNVSIYTGLRIEDDVFLGPSCVLTNVTNPRSQVVRRGLYETTILKRGCSVGANATVVCGIMIGRYAFIGAGAVVAKDVPDYALMMGVPARRVGWVSRHGLPLKDPDGDGVYICPESKLRYQETETGVLRCLDVGEDDPLPDDMKVGRVYYDDLIHGDHLRPDD